MSSSMQNVMTTGLTTIMSITTMNRGTNTMNTMNTTRIMGKNWPARAISSI